MLIFSADLLCLPMHGAYNVIICMPPGDGVDSNVSGSRDLCCPGAHVPSLGLVGLLKWKLVTATVSLYTV